MTRRRILQSLPVALGLPLTLAADEDAKVDWRTLRGLNYRVIAAGDSYNDTAMLGAAHRGFLFHAPDNVRSEFPHFPAVDEYAELLALITDAL